MTNIKDIAYFISQHDSQAFARIEKNLALLGADGPQNFGTKVDDATDMEAKRTLLSTALEVAIAEFDKCEKIIRNRLSMRNKIKLTLNIIAAVSASGLLTMIGGGNTNTAPWDLLAALVVLLSSIGTIIIDHLKFSPSAFEELIQGSSEREKARSALLRLRLLNPIDAKALHTMEEPVLETITTLNILKNRLNLKRYRQK